MKALQAALATVSRRMILLVAGVFLSYLSWGGISLTQQFRADGKTLTGEDYSSGTIEGNGSILKVNRLSDAPSWLTEAWLEPAGEGNAWVNLLEASGSSSSVGVHFKVAANTTSTERSYQVKVLRSADSSVFATVTIKQAGSGSGTGESANAPEKPTSVRAEPVSSSSIRITWEAAARATSYKVYRAPAGHYELSDFVCVASGIAGTSYLDTGLAADTMYYYRVAACNAAGENMSQYMDVSWTLEDESAKGDFGFPPSGELYSRLGWSSAVCIYDANASADDRKKYNPLSTFEAGRKVLYKFLYVNFGEKEIPFVDHKVEVEVKQDGLWWQLSSSYGSDDTTELVPPNGLFYNDGWSWPTLAKLDPGTYRLKVTLDPDEAVSDVDRSDNVAYFPFTVTASSTPPSPPEDPTTPAKPSSETVSVPAAGGSVSSSSVRNDTDASWTFDDGDSPSWITDISVGYMTLKRNGKAVNRNQTTNMTGPWSFAFKVAANSGAARQWTMTVKNASTKEVVWSVVVKQAAGNGGGTSGESGNTQQPKVVEKKFGPGQASSFKVGANVQATVVGVSGLTWCDFAARAYSGEGRNGQTYNVFDDSRIVDVEKNSTVENNDEHRTDDYWCEGFSELDCLLWAGWLTSANGDAIADEMRASGDQWGYYNWLKSGFSYDYQDSPSSLQDVVKGFAAADRLYRLCVVFPNYVWKGSRGVGHCVVCCGYALDTAKSIADPTALKGLFIIDPDNDMYNGKGGASAPNSITYCPVSWNAANGTYSIANVFGTTGSVGINSSDWLGFRTATAPTLSKTVDNTWPVACGASRPSLTVDVPVVQPSGAFSAPKAKLQSGVVLKANQEAFGVVQVKVGKASKAGMSKVSATVIGVDGKKYTAKGVKVPVGGTPAVKLEVRNLGTLTLTFGANGFSGSLNGMKATSVAGTSATTAGVATFAATNLSSLKGALTAYLPSNEQVLRSAKKWKVANKGGRLKYVKPNAKKGVKGGLQATGKNLSALKLTYTAKKQIFKGSFKVWTFDSAKLKLKGVTVKVTGVVVNGKGYGQVTNRKAKIGDLTVR